MTHLRIRCDFNDGRRIEVTPTGFEALTVAQLERTIISPSDEIEFVFYGTDAIVDGATIEGTPCVTTRINFPHSPAPYALVPYGWLPMPFAMPQHFLVDRNVVATLRSIRTRGTRQNDASFYWWTNLFEGGSGLYNPLLFAYEGSQRRTPTMKEFVSSFNEGATELKASLPKANIVKFRREHFEIGYEKLIALGARAARDSQFLLQTIPLVVNRVARHQEQVVQAQVLKCARNLGVTQHAPIVLAILSVLYEDVHGTRLSYGRRLLKPKTGFKLEDAYNAISDLRHIELAALSQAVLPEQAFALCTNDRGIALFWSALEFRSEATEDSLLNLWYSLGTDLFQRLSEEEIKSLMRAIRHDA